MNPGMALRNAEPIVYTRADPRLQLLLELEPGYRVFFRNLADLVWPRNEPPLFLAAQPVSYRRHYYYVRTGVRWSVVLQSLAWHLAMVPWLLALWTMSAKWKQQEQYSLQQTRRALSQAKLTYYPSLESFPAREGIQNEKPAPERTAVSRRSILHVAAERGESSVTMPKVRFHGSAQLAMASSNPILPAVPLSAMATARLRLPAVPTAVAGPPPEITQFSSRRVTSPQITAIEPPPQMEEIRNRRGIAAPVTQVIAPTPNLQAAVHGQRTGRMDLGPSTAVVIAPSPQLPMGTPRAGRGLARGISRGPGVAIVPPPPSASGLVVLAGGGGKAVAGVGVPTAVPPAPSARGTVIFARGDGNSLAGVGMQKAGMQIVPPPPSITASGILGVSGYGGGDGKRNGGKFFSSLRGQAVPPPPLLGQALSLASGGGDSRSGAGAFVVPPPPSLAATEGFGGGGTGRGKSFSGTDTSGSALAPSATGNGGGSAGAGSASSFGASSSGQGTESAAGASSMASSVTGEKTVATLISPAAAGAVGQQSQPAPMVRSVVPPSPPMADEPGGTTRELPLHIVQLALALPTSSYFSNYEAFVAERTLNNRATELIKLVYIFLPYERRLTEYGVNTSKIFKLRVTRDPSCDESLLSMTWPEGEKTSTPAANSPDSSKNKLPCYRTTASDYRKALARAR